MDSIPKELREFEGIEEYRIAFFHYVYFLYDKEELVYIGKTSNQLSGRIALHQVDKQFAKCYILQFTDKEACSAKEKELIHKFEPKYNKIPHRPSYPQVGRTIRYHGKNVKVVSIVNDHVIGKVRKQDVPLVIPVKEIMVKKG